MAYLSALALGALSAVAAVRGETAGLTLWLDFFALMVSLNIGLGIFNLIPFPPLDGSKVVAMFLPRPVVLPVDAAGAVRHVYPDGRPVVRGV